MGHMSSHPLRVVGVLFLCTLSVYSMYALGCFESAIGSVVAQPVTRRCPHASGPTRRAVITVLSALSDEYVRYAAVLGHSLELLSDLECGVDRVLIVPRDAPFALQPAQRLMLRRAGWTLHALPDITPPQTLSVHTVKHARYVTCFFKLHVFNMTQYAEVLLLDADTMACGGLMELFRIHIPLMRAKRARLAWARDLGCLGPGPCTFNAGVLLVRPSRPLADRLANLIRTTESVFPFAEQSFLELAFSKPQVSHIIPQKFNILASLSKTDPPLFQELSADPRVFHFTWFKPAAPFFLLRCAYLGTLRFCKQWEHLRIVAGV